MSNQKKLKLPINYVGWVGHLNIGDEAIFLANTKLFNQHSFNPILTSKSSNITLFGGGTIFPDFCQAVTPTKYNYAIGIGAKNPAFWGDFNSYSIEMVKRHRFRFIGVRGNLSQKILKKFNIESKVVGDTCLFLEPTTYPHKNNNLIAINVGKSPDGIWGDSKYLLEQMIEFCKYLKLTGYQVVLIPFWKNDVPYVRQLSEAADVPIFKEWNDVQKVIDFIASCYILVGQKLHSIVLSATTYTPFLCLEYRPKCMDFAESVGFKKYTIRTDQVTSSALKELFVDLVNNWNDNHILLKNKVNYYRKTLKEFAAQINNDIESLPCDKWDIPGYFHSLKNKFFWGTEYYFYNNFERFWNILSGSKLRKYYNHYRDLLLFGKP